MAEPIANYTPQLFLAKLRKRAFFSWLAVSILAFFWLFFIVSAPVFEANGVKSVSRPLYGFFSYICHQLDSRSFHIMAHQFGVCSRCFGVYLGFFIGLLIYPLFRKIEEIEPFPRVWLFLAMIPIGIDFSLGFFGLWENNHLSRVITGGILGLACGIYIVPALADISRFLVLKAKKT